MCWPCSNLQAFLVKQQVGTETSEERGNKQDGAPRFSGFVAVFVAVGGALMVPRIIGPCHKSSID